MTKPKLFPFHSKGFPAKTYGSLLEEIGSWNPETINVLGADLPSLGGSMTPLVEELIRQVTPAKGKAIGIGHSMGTSSAYCPMHRNRISFKV